MNCCSQKSSLSSPDKIKQSLSEGPQDAPAIEHDTTPRGMTCDRASRPVKRQTMFLMLKPDRFHRIAEGKYRFCSDPECDIVYFTDGDGACFTTSDLRIRVGVKQTEGPIPLCYCFGFDEEDVREEIAVRGHTTIPQRIAHLLREGMCACSTRNPSGACCLRDVERAVSRLCAARGPDQ